MRVLPHDQVALLNMGNNPSWEIILIDILSFYNFPQPPPNWCHVFHRAQNVQKGTPLHKISALQI